MVQTVKNILMKHVQKKLVKITNIKIKGTSRCADCLAHKSFVDELEVIAKDKDELEVIATQFLLD